ncbi:MAG: sulfite exporter TauE/SafE family protein [Gemmatimonadetes bacterium]|nr:sulfite exporter TauE/SafE family protein [Gemmatimonadota bacterium]
MPFTIDLGTSLTDHPLLGLALTFAGGVVTSLTPCLYPMIPITAAIVGGGTTAEGSGRSRRRAAVLTMAYVLGLTAVYATLGLIAGLTGTLFGGISTNPWSLFLQGNLLLLFALMMLDVVAVPIPARWQHRAATQSTGGRAVGALLMGAASGLVAAPCGAPVFGAVLTWVTRTGSALLGFGYLFAFSLGMSALLVAVGLTSGLAATLPRAGAWMLWVKRGFAVLMLGAAEYYFITMGSLLI